MSGPVSCLFKNSSNKIINKKNVIPSRELSRCQKTSHVFTFVQNRNIYTTFFHQFSLFDILVNYTFNFDLIVTVSVTSSLDGYFQDAGYSKV